MTVMPLRFSATALIDMGGSGIRLDVAKDNGDMFPDMHDPFRGAVNLRFNEVKGELTLDNILTQLADKFIAKRLKSSETAQTILKVLTQEPLKRTVASTAGQIQSQDGYQYITAASNMPSVLQNTDFLGAFRRIFTQRLRANGMEHLVSPNAFNAKGLIVNDALAGVMALAKHLETSQGKPLTESSPPVIMLDVGSGIATGGISGNMLYTAESQNTRGLMSQSMLDRIEELLKKGQTQAAQTLLAQSRFQSLEDRGSMRGMTQQTVALLKSLPVMERLANPHYKTIVERALKRDSQRPADEQRFQGKVENFDRFFEDTSLPALQAQSWPERWVSENALLLSAMENPEDTLAKTVFEGVVDALAALASNKVMETGANKVYLQFIDMEQVMATVNFQRQERELPPLENPLPKLVQQRMWDAYLHPGIAPTFFDQAKGVELADLRNIEGTAAVAQAFSKQRKNPWRIKGISLQTLRKQV